MPVYLLALPESTKSRVEELLTCAGDPRYLSSIRPVPPSDSLRTPDSNPSNGQGLKASFLPAYHSHECPSPAKSGFAVSALPENHPSSFQSSAGSPDTRASQAPGLDSAAQWRPGLAFWGVNNCKISGVHGVIDLSIFTSPVYRERDLPKPYRISLGQAADFQLHVLFITPGSTRVRREANQNTAIQPRAETLPGISEKEEKYFENIKGYFQMSNECHEHSFKIFNTLRLI